MKSSKRGCETTYTVTCSELEKTDKTVLEDMNTSDFPIRNESIDN